MKKYEKPSVERLEVSSTEDMAAFLKFDTLDGNFQAISSYLETSGKGYEA